MTPLRQGAPPPKGGRTHIENKDIKDMSMKQSKLLEDLSRRQLLIAAGRGSAIVATVTLFPGQLWADFPSIDEAIKSVAGDRVPAEGRIELILPQIAENGNTVPIEIMVDSPMSETDYVKSIHIFADGNPNPSVATYNFTPACGEARCATRIRLAKTQNVIAVAEMSNGELYMAKSEVKVTIGGCGG
jgi:sulfur-oxidizing protein SoxY